MRVSVYVNVCLSIISKFVYVCSVYFRLFPSISVYFRLFLSISVYECLGLSKMCVYVCLFLTMPVFLCLFMCAYAYVCLLSILIGKIESISDCVYYTHFKRLNLSKANKPF